MNKIRVLLFIVLVQVLCTAYAKDEVPTDSTMFTVGYNFRVNTKDVDGTPVVDSLQMVLLVGHQYTKSMGYYSFWTKNNGATQETFDRMAGEERAHVPIILRNIAEKYMTIYEDIPVHHYVYEEDEIKAWDILEDTLTIRGFLCNKAQTNYGGRTWTVWFTEDVPSTAGPWKFNGLPGLIVRCVDDASIFSFELFELLNRVFPITMEEALKPNVKIKRNKFIARRNKLFLNPRYMSDPLYYYQPSDADEQGYSLWSIEKAPRNPDGSIPLNVVRKLINGVAIPWKCNEYQPLELE